MPYKAVVFAAADTKKTAQVWEKFPKPGYLVTGRYDLATIGQNETPKALVEWVNQNVRSIDGILRTETYPVLQEVTKPAAADAPFKAFVLIRTQPAKTQQVFGSVAGLTEANWVGAVTGRIDVIAQVNARNWEEFSNLLLNKVRAIDGIRSTETLWIGA